MASSHGRESRETRTRKEPGWYELYSKGWMTDSDSETSEVESSEESPESADEELSEGEELPEGQYRVERLVAKRKQVSRLFN